MQMEILMKHIPGGVHQCRNDAELTLMEMSEGFLTMFGYSREDIRQRFDNKFINMIYPDDRQVLFDNIKKQLASGGNNLELEYRVMHANGRCMWILDKGRLGEDENGEKCFYCILIEIAKRKKEQEALRLSLERHKIITDQTTDIIFEWNIASDSMNFSPNWKKKFGYEAIHTQITRKIPNSPNIHPEDMPSFVRIMEETRSGVPYCETEFRIRNAQGNYLWNRIRATTQFDDAGQAIKVVGVIIDINTEKQERQELMDLAQRDTLTGLYNKGAIKKLTEERMQGKNSDRIQAMMIIDIDNFKWVNDKYGHLCGDSILSDVAQALRENFRSSDLIGRIGGDEFLVYLPEVSGEYVVKNKAEELLRRFSQIRPMQEEAPISCSVGVALYTGEEGDYFQLYKRADQALYYRKKQGKCGVTTYSLELEKEGLLPKTEDSAVGGVIDFEDMTVIDEKLAQYTFRILYHSKDIENAVNQLLEIVGRAYNVSRVYIFEDSEDEKSCSNTFEWCAPSIPSEREKLQNISYEKELKAYRNNFEDNGIFYCDNISKLAPDLISILEPQGIHALLQCAIIDNGKFKGYVGFDECSGSRRWNKQQIFSLNLVANILSIFLTKLRLEEKLKLKESQDL